MKVAVYFATGFEEVEALSVVDILRRGQVEVVMVGVSGKSAVSSRGISINMDQVIEEVNHQEIDMMVLPGGMPGVNHLMESDLLIKTLKCFKEQGKWLAAICAAPSILGRLDLLQGHEATCYPGYEEQLQGCQYRADGVVVSDKIVTGKGAGFSIQFALKLLELIKGTEVMTKVKKGMLIED